VARRATRWRSRKVRASGLQSGIADLLAGELGLSLVLDLAIASLVAWREVEDLQALDAGGTRHRPGLPRRQVIALARLVDVRLEEGRFAEEEIGAGGEAGHGGDV